MVSLSYALMRHKRDEHANNSDSFRNGWIHCKFYRIVFLNMDECRDHEFTHHQVMDQVHEIFLVRIDFIEYLILILYLSLLLLLFKIVEYTFFLF